MVDRPHWCAAMQGQLDRLEKWADRKAIKFSKGNVKSCPWGWTFTSTGWGTPSCWKAALQKRTWGLNKLTTSLECALAPKTTNSLLSCAWKRAVSRLRKEILPPCSALVGTSEVLDPMYLRDGIKGFEHLTWETERARTIQPGEEKLQVFLVCVISIYMYVYKHVIEAVMRQNS